MERASNVVLTVPAQPAYVRLVRTATAAVCAQADFPIDTLDDLAIAVDEAFAIVIDDAPPEAEVRVVLSVNGNSVHIDVDADTASGRPVSRDTFAWTVLTALVDEVDTEVADGRLRIGLSAHGIDVVTS
jgi:serine/threonine-protein kinase RsbW